MAAAAEAAEEERRRKAEEEEEEEAKKAKKAKRELNWPVYRKKEDLKKLAKMKNRYKRFVTWDEFQQARTFFFCYVRRLDNGLL